MFRVIELGQCFSVIIVLYFSFYFVVKTNNESPYLSVSLIEIKVIYNFSQSNHECTARISLTALQLQLNVNVRIL